MLLKKQETMKITFNQNFLSRVDFMRAVARYLMRENKDCQVLDLYHVMVDNKKYFIREQNLTPEGAKCIHNALLLPVEE